MYKKVLSIGCSGDALEDHNLSRTSLRRFLTLELLIYGGGNCGDLIRNFLVKVCQRLLLRLFENLKLLQIAICMHISGPVFPPLKDQIPLIVIIK